MSSPRESDFIPRRRFLAKLWRWGLGLLGFAGAATTLDILTPRQAAGFGGTVDTLPVDAVPKDAPEEIRAIRGYVTEIKGEIVALSWKCPHLGCKVPWCDSSGQFECPCHGSKFNRLGEYREGPAPRGMDRYAVEIAEDGVVRVDTGDITLGPPPGTETLDEPIRGPNCIGGEA
jgi:cytochrome b6-f complex iron-sulfur subunit